MRTAYHVTIEGPHGTAWCRHVDRASAEQLARASYRKGTGLRRCPDGLRAKVMPYQVGDDTLITVRSGFDGLQDLFGEGRRPA